tara:strand:+ start:2224 stop:3387 length:1164 start_codon:yes stop_codon:yes gene_type:complete
MNINFTIDNENLESLIDVNATEIKINSSPRPYNVLFTDNFSNYIKDELKNKDFSYIFFIDKNILNLFKDSFNFLENYPSLVFEAIESKKNVDAAFELCDKLLEYNANRKTKLFVIGGGIVQDIGAYAAATFKRGIPWIYIPTTLLGQGDSCVGGKTGLNYKDTKNLIALFSAPRSVIIDPIFNTSLESKDIYSGHGEIMRLAITGGKETFYLYKNLFQQLNRIDKINNQDINIIKQMLRLSLQVKKSVVENDEFEINIRKSMNYGHSIGHAIEILANHKIPHGQAVSIGIMIENKIASSYLGLDKKVVDEIFKIANLVVSNESKQELARLNNMDIVEVMKRDKKVEGKILKLATLSDYGVMHFIDFPLNSDSNDLIKNCINSIISKI